MRRKALVGGPRLRQWSPFSRSVGQPLRANRSAVVHAGYSLVKAKVAPAADKNGDGWICKKAVQGGANGFNDIDNKPNQ